MSTAAPTLEREHQAHDIEGEPGEGSKRLGRAFDAVGIISGVVLGVILFDILSGGKLTKWARARRHAPGQSDGPCEGCGDESGADE